jgi:putative transposase
VDRRVRKRRTFPGEETRQPPPGTMLGTRKGTPMLKVLDGGKAGKGRKGNFSEDAQPATTHVVPRDGGDSRSGRLPMDLDELAKEGARRMIAAALQVEVQDYLERHADARAADGRALVVRNGAAQPRSLTIGAGTVELRAPRVNDKRVIDGERQRFRSRILPPYTRRSPKIEAVLPVLYLRGLSTGDFKAALKDLLGDDAAGLSPSAITRLTEAWQGEYASWRQRSLADRDYVYVWVDGVHFGIRLEDDPLAALVVIGVRPDGTKELVACEDGYRESEEAWLSLLRDLKAHGMRDPVLAVGDGALGFWKAKRTVWPQTREQRCWFHKLGNVLDKLPKRLQSEGKTALHEVMFASTRKDAEEAITRFSDRYRADHRRAVTCLVDDQDALLAFFAYPEEHWKHLRTTNPIESTFSTVRLRTRVTKGAGSRAAGLAMTFKLLTVAAETWRRIDAHELVPLVRAGVRFMDGKRVERDAHPEERPEIKSKSKRRRAAA